MYSYNWFLPLDITCSLVTPRLASDLPRRSQTLAPLYSPSLSVLKLALSCLVCPMKLASALPERPAALPACNTLSSLAAASLLWNFILTARLTGFTIFSFTTSTTEATTLVTPVTTVFLAASIFLPASLTILSRPRNLANLPAFSVTQSITALIGANIASMPFNRFCATGLFFTQSLTIPVSELNPSTIGWKTPLTKLSKSFPILTMLSHTALPLPVKIPTTKSVKWSKKSDIGIIISSSIVTILCSIGLSLVQSKRAPLIYFHIRDNAITISPTIFKPANNLGSAFSANIGSLLNNLLNILPIPPPPILPKTPVSLDNNLPPMFPKSFVIGLKILLTNGVTNLAPLLTTFPNNLNGANKIFFIIPVSIGSSPPKPSILDKPPINPLPPPLPLVAILFIGVGLVLSLALYTPFPLSFPLSSLSSIFFCKSYSLLIIFNIWDNVAFIEFNFSSEVLPLSLSLPLSCLSLIFLCSAAVSFNTFDKSRIESVVFFNEFVKPVSIIELVKAASRTVKVFSSMESMSLSIAN